MTIILLYKKNEVEDMTNKQYSKIVERNSLKSNTVVNCAKAFVIGGGICVLGQLFFELFSSLGLDEDTSKTVASVSLILK